MGARFPCNPPSAVPSAETPPANEEEIARKNRKIARTWINPLWNERILEWKLGDDYNSSCVLTFERHDNEDDEQMKMDLTPAKALEFKERLSISYFDQPILSIRLVYEHNIKVLSSMLIEREIREHGLVEDL